MERADQFVVFTGRQMSRSAQAFLEWLRDEAAVAASTSYDTQCPQLLLVHCCRR
jgi:hypothetical protein